MAILRRIGAEGFRNLKGVDIELDPVSNLIYGPNGAGKSNLLEAIYYLCYLRSYRNAIEEELIGFDRDGFSLEGVGADKTAVVRLKDGKKKVILNSVERRRYSDYAGWIDCVVLTLSDIWIVRGSPTRRREWLDILISRIRPDYYRELIEYRSILKQRNQLLLKGRMDGEIEAWTDRLVAVGKRIYRLRHAIFPEIENIYQELSDDLRLESTITYQPSTEPESFRADLEASQPRESEIGQTTVGPHRDEIVIKKSGHNMKGYGSEGEQRLSGIILRIVEQELFKKKKKDPILLLDEPFIEIDNNYRARVEELLKRSHQLIIASTRDSNWGRRFKINGGRIEVAG